MSAFLHSPSQSLSVAIVAANTASASNTIVAAPSDATKRIAVYAWAFVVTSAGSQSWFSNTTALSGVRPFGAGAGEVRDVRMDGEPWFLCAAGEALKWTLTATMGIGGEVYYKLV